MRGGKRPGAGRPRGALGKKTKLTHTKAILEKAAAQKLTPLEFLLQNMQRHIKAKNWDAAERSAALAAPYMHPKLAAMTVTRRPSLAEMSADEIRAFIAASEAALGIPPGASAGLADPGATKH